MYPPFKNDDADDAVNVMRPSIRQAGILLKNVSYTEAIEKTVPLKTQRLKGQ